MKSKIFSANIYKDNIKRQIWILAILGLAYFFCYPLGTFMKFAEWNRMKYSYAQIDQAYTNYFMKDMLSMGLVILILAAVIAGVAGFSYLHSRQKVDFYHSLPVRRECFMASQIAASLTLWLIPYIAAVFLSICIGASKGHFSMSILKTAGISAGVNLLFFLMIYACTVLAMLLTGNLLVGILGTFVILGYAPAIMMLLYGQFQKFFPAFSSESLQYGVYHIIGHYGSPVSWYVSIIDGLAKGKTGVSIIAVLLVVLLLFAGCFWLYKIRTSESAGRAMAFQKGALVIQMLLEIPISIGMGLFFVNFFSSGTKEEIVWWIFGLILGLVLCHGIVESIYRADYKKFFADRKVLAASGAAVAVISFIFGVDPLHYNTYLPEEAQLKTVGIHTGALSYELDAGLTVQKDQNGDSYVISSGSGSYLPIKTDTETYSWLKQMLEEYKDYKWYNTDFFETQNKTYLSLEYELENGRKLYRNYYADKKQVEEKVLEATNDKAFREGMYSGLDTLGDYADSVAFSSSERYEELFNTWGKEERTQQEREEIQKLFAALRKDVDEADRTVFEENPVGTLNVSGNLQDFSLYNYSWNTGYCIYPGFKNTIAFLKEKNIEIPKEIQADDISSITIYDYQEGEEQSEETVYTKPEEIQKLLPCLVPDTVTVPWKNTDDLKSAKIKWKDSGGRDSESYYSLNAGKLPDFL